MKIALLGPGSSIHLVRWANALSDVGIEVHLITQHRVREPLRQNIVVYLHSNRGVLGYFLMVPSVRRQLNKIQPDIVHVHYASGYGTTARLAGYHPLLMSVWGSDVYEFPAKSYLHRQLVTRNLCAADRISSTSHCMAKRVCELDTNADVSTVEVVPFGVDCDIFTPLNPSRKIGQNENSIVIGTIKTLSHGYGIDLLLRAFCSVKKRMSASHSLIVARLKLRIVGAGPDLEVLREMAESLGISADVEFVGAVPHSRVISELHKLDIFVALSRAESFGVAAIEAGAAGLPVVVSDAEGLAEVVLHESTGLIVKMEDYEEAAGAIVRLIVDENLRCTMGRRGREHVLRNYSWSRCVDEMVRIYELLISDYPGGSSGRNSTFS